MHINLDNISFYQPPPPKPSQPTASYWKLYNAPPVPQALSHPLPPKPPTPITNIPISGKQPTTVQQSRGPTKEDEDSAAAAFRNAFDVELERVSMAESNSIVREADALDVPQCQGVSPTAAPYAVSSEPAQPLAGADDGEDITFEPAVEQHALRKQSNHQTQPPGGTVCYSSPSLTPSDLNDSVPLVATTDSVGFRQESLLSSVTCTETDETTPSGAGTPSSYTSRSPSPGLLDNVPYLRRGVSPAGTNQCDKAVIEDTRTEAAACVDRAGDLGDRASTTQDIQINSPSGSYPIPDNFGKHRGPDKDQIPALSSPGQQPQLRPVRHPRINLMHKRTLRRRPNEKNVRPNNLPSVAVVIPVRRSGRLATGTARDHPTKTGRRRSRDSSLDDAGEDNPLAHDSIEDHSLSLSGSEREEGGRPCKKRRLAPQPRKVTGNSISTNKPARRCTDSSQKPSEHAVIPAPREEQEVFGRGILRIHRHGPRNAYVITFLPDTVHNQPMPSSSEASCDSLPDNDSGSSVSKSPFKSHGSSRQTRCKPIHYSSRMGVMGETEDKGLRRTRHRSHSHGVARCADGKKRPQVSSRKGMPWSEEEEDLLRVLREERGLRWPEVARRFAEKFPGRSQGSIQVYWSSRLK